MTDPTPDAAALMHVNHAVTVKGLDEYGRTLFHVVEVGGHYAAYVRGTGGIVTETNLSRLMTWVTGTCASAAVRAVEGPGQAAFDVTSCPDADDLIDIATAAAEDNATA